MFKSKSANVTGNDEFPTVWLDNFPLAKRANFGDAALD
jgi:hypothetical protein